MKKLSNPPAPEGVRPPAPPGPPSLVESNKISWKPIGDYKPQPYAGYDPMVLLGWWFYGGGGYTPGVKWFGCGYLGSNGKWHDVSHKKEWPTQPTHFALVCDDIPGGEQPS